MTGLTNTRRCRKVQASDAQVDLLPCRKELDFSFEILKSGFVGSARCERQPFLAFDGRWRPAELLAA